MLQVLWSVAVQGEIKMLQSFRHIRIVFLLLALILVGSVSTIAAAAGTDEKPNIVLVLMDNFGW